MSVNFSSKAGRYGDEGNDDVDDEDDMDVAAATDDEGAGDEAEKNSSTSTNEYS